MTTPAPEPHNPEPIDVHRPTTWQLRAAALAALDLASASARSDLAKVYRLMPTDLDHAQLVIVALAEQVADLARSVGRAGGVNAVTVLNARRHRARGADR